MGAYAEERVLSGSLNECWPHTCDACVLKNNLEIRIGGSYRRPELFFGLFKDSTFATKSSANPRSPTFLVRGIRQAKYPVKKFNELRYLKTEEEGESVLKNRLSFWNVKTFVA